MCKSPSVSRKPSAVSASPRCDAGNSALPGSRGAILKARRGGAVIKRPVGSCTSPVRIMAASAMSRKVIAGYGTGSRSEMELTASGGDVNAANSSGPYKFPGQPLALFREDAGLTL
jgi:hypothetical protein